MAYDKIVDSRQLDADLLSIANAIREKSGSRTPLNFPADFVTEIGKLGGDGLTDEIKQAILQLGQKVAYIDAEGQAYYNDLYNALYPPNTVVLLTAVFRQGSTVIYDDTALDDLKQHLTVTAKYDDNTTSILPDSAYTLSGLLEAPSSTVTVLYNGVSTTFSVAVTARPTLSSITAVYTQSGTVHDTDTLDSLKADLVVTAVYSDSSTQTVPAADYMLSGTLTVGTSTITVTYGGKTASFDVTVESGYQQVEYIEATTAGPVIDTLYAVGANAEIRCGMQQLVASNNAAMFGRTSPSILSFMWSTSEFYVNFARQSSMKVAGLTYFNAIHDVVLNKDEFIFDGVKKASFSGSLLEFSTDRHMLIFAWSNDDDNTPTRQTAGRCSYFQIYDSGTLVVDLVPCYRKSDGVIGMYDRVSGAFRTNVGTGTFTKGGDVT